MEIIPLIHLKKRKIVLEEDEFLSINELLKIVDKDRKIYILDLDGIEKNKPNLCLYPKLTEEYRIWVDSGPRNLGDVVDSIMAGATDITVRNYMWPELNISSIKEITEQRIYLHIDPKSKKTQSIGIDSLRDIDGLVSLTNKHQMDSDFKYTSFLKAMGKKYIVYAYDSNQKNFSYWKSIGIGGLFMDVKKSMEFKINEF